MPQRSGRLGHLSFQIYCFDTNCLQIASDKTLTCLHHGKEHFHSVTLYYSGQARVQAISPGDGGNRFTLCQHSRLWNRVNDYLSPTCSSSQLLGH